MDLLDLEPGLVTRLRPIFSGHLMGFKKTLESVLEETLFHLSLAQIEEVLVGLLELEASSKLLN